VRSQDFPISRPTNREQEKMSNKDQPQKDPKRAIMFAKVNLITLRPIEQAMNDNEKQKTGVAKLSQEELTNLNEWLNANAVLAPGDQPH
jgi:hypothetical protein